ncbi:hypothetical protein Bbelb_386560 [Branchiostoma belcheri]|nr:hypothetical protein Bbelb_386560 [Branchiostoma belcheri]
MQIPSGAGDDKTGHPDPDSPFAPRSCGVANACKRSLLETTQSHLPVCPRLLPHADLPKWAGLLTAHFRCVTASSRPASGPYEHPPAKSHFLISPSNLGSIGPDNRVSCRGVVFPYYPVTKFEQTAEYGTRTEKLQFVCAAAERRAMSDAAADPVFGDLGGRPRVSVTTSRHGSAACTVQLGDKVVWLSRRAATYRVLISVLLNFKH